MIHASIDLGTNTCLLLVANAKPKKNNLGHPPYVLDVLKEESSVIRLGEGVDHHRMLQPEPMKRAYRCLQHYSVCIRSFGLAPQEVVCVATSQARDAKNHVDFFLKIQKDIGFIFQVISGQEEAHYTFLGALSPFIFDETMIESKYPEKDATPTLQTPVFVLDIGGGSTELISEQQGKSIDIGSVRLTERFLKSNPVSPLEFSNCQQAIDCELENLHSWYETQLMTNPKGTPRWIAVAGTATTLAFCVARERFGLEKFEAKKLEGMLLKKLEVEQFAYQLKSQTIEERTQFFHLDPLRADVILAGVLIFLRILEKFKIPHCHVSTRGLRYGVLLNAIQTQL